MSQKVCIVILYRKQCYRTVNAIRDMYGINKYKSVIRNLQKHEV